MSDKPRILLVDDDPDLIHLLRFSLTKAGYQVEQALHGKQALEAAHAFHPHVVVTDLMMPDIDGTEVCRKLKADPDLHPIYVIMLTAKRGADSQIDNLQVGADDYMIKPVVLRELRARIQVGLRWIESQTHWQKMATSDSLTSLPNRYVLDKVLEREIAYATSESTPLSMFLLDLDEFKQINDTFGHVVGDRALQHLADIIRSQVRGTDIPARYGGEEFVIVLPGVEEDTAINVAKRLHAIIASDLWPAIVASLRGSSLQAELEKRDRLTASIGVASLEFIQDRTPEVFLRAADSATYRAKQAGRNRVCLYRPEGWQDECPPEDGAGKKEETLLYDLAHIQTAMEQVGPARSLRDPGMPRRLLELLQARAIGWVRWQQEAPPVLMDSVGVDFATAEQISRYLPWAELPVPSDWLGKPLSSITIRAQDVSSVQDLHVPKLETVAVPAIDSEGRLVGGIWIAWEDDVPLEASHRLILSWLTQTLGLELEVEDLKVNGRRA